MERKNEQVDRVATKPVSRRNERTNQAIGGHSHVSARRCPATIVMRLGRAAVKHLAGYVFLLLLVGGQPGAVR